MKVYVTGAGGFIGHHLVRELRQQGHRVSGLVGALGDGFPEPIGLEQAHYFDVADPQLMTQAINGCDAVFHLAGPASVAASFENPRHYLRTHAEGTLAVLQACKTCKISRLIYLSSAEVYGDPGPGPVAESAELKARSPYGAAKIAAEQLIRSSVSAYGLKAVILRPFSIYGPGMSARSLIGTLFSELSKNKAIRIQTLSPVRDYVSVWDAVAAICLALQWEGQFEIFNLCSGEGISVHRLIQLAQTVFQADLPIFETGSPRPTDLTYLVGNPQKIQSQLQWQAQINLQEGLARLHSEEKTKVREAK